MKNFESDWSIAYRLISVAELGLMVYLCNYAYEHLDELSWWKITIIIICAIGQLFESYDGIINGLDDKKKDGNE